MKNNRCENSAKAKQVEEALRTSLENYRYLVKYAPTGIYEIDFATGKFVHVNDAMCQYLGYTEEELLTSVGAFDILDDESIKLFKERIKKILAGEKIDENIEYRGKTKDGRIFWTMLNVKLIYKDNKPQGALVVAQDITERKRVEEELKQAQSKVQEYANNLEKLVEERSKQVEVERERFFNMLENMPVMVCLITADYKIPFANRMFREAFGDSRGRCCYEYVGSVQAPCEQCGSLVPLKTGKPHHWTATFPNGTVVDAHDFPFTDVDGTKMILEADIDITERINLQKQLQEKERLAAIGATAGMVGHDIRNPLQAITGDIFLAKAELAELPESEKKKNALESLQEIEKNIDYINKIVQDLQDYARPLNPNPGESDLKLIIDKLLKKNDFPKNVKVTIKVEPDARCLKADADYLNRILYNLVTNAIQAMPKGGELTIHVYKEASDVVITVKDTGVGIPKAIQSKMFTPMFTTKSKGQGFGLPVVKRMTESLGGTVSFESEEGKGTKFIIELPITN